MKTYMRQGCLLENAPRFFKALLLFTLCLSLLLPIRAQENEPSFFEEALETSKLLDPDTNVEEARAEFKKLVESCKKSLEAERTKFVDGVLKPQAVIGVLNREILLSREVSYLSNQYWRDSLFTAALKAHKGNCLSTSLLYYFVARELELPVTVQFFPNHAMIRWDDGKTVLHIETTNKGTLKDPLKLMNRFDLSEADLAPNGFMLKLTEPEIRSHLEKNWANGFFSMHMREQAWDFIKRAQTHYPTDLDRLRLESRFLDAEGKLEEADKMLADYCKYPVGPWKRAESALLRADRLSERGKHEEAITLLRDNVLGSPGRMQTRILLAIGRGYRQKRQPDMAVPFYENNAAQEPGEKSLSALGAVYSEAGRNQDAIAVFEEARRLNPESYYTLIELSVLYERVGEKEKGRTLFASIKEPRGAKLNWHREVAFYYSCIGDEKTMLDHMRQSFEMDSSGDTFRYFMREQQMDPYREHDGFKELMKKYTPKEIETAITKLK